MATLDVHRVPLRIDVRAGALVPAAAFGALFAAVAARAGLPVLPAALVGGVGGAVSLLVHELGHLLAGRGVAGIRLVSVSLVAFGAATRFEGRYERPLDQARVAAAGPAASFALALALVGVRFAPLQLAVKEIVVMLALLNVVIGAMSLIPAAPLDGHKLVVASLWGVLGSEAAAQRFLRRTTVLWIGLELLASSALLVERPPLGATALVMGTTLVAQRRILRRV
jgi:Zn-dependent protease